MATNEQKQHSVLDEVAAELEYLMSAAERPGTVSHADADDAERRLLAHVRGLKEQLEAERKRSEIKLSAWKALEEQLEAMRVALDLFVNQPELVGREDYIGARQEFFGSPDGRVVAYPASEPQMGRPVYDENYKTTDWESSPASQPDDEGATTMAQTLDAFRSPRHPDIEAPAPASEPDDPQFEYDKRMAGVPDE